MQAIDTPGMPPVDSALDPIQIALARALLAAPIPPQRAWVTVTAAAFAATSALALATATILAPPVGGERAGLASAP